LQIATNAGRVLRYRHDAAGRLVGRSGTSGDGGIDIDESYELDGCGRVSAARSDRFGRVAFTRDADGRVQGVQADGIERAWRHDDQGRLVGYEQQVAGTTSTTALIRDASGHVVGVVTDGGTTAYRYDAAGQLVAVDDGDASATFAYDEGGRLLTEGGPLGTTTYEYDAAHQLVAVDAPSGRTRFTYDGAGQRVARDGPTGTRTWTWDGLQRLTAIADTPVSVDALGRLDTVGSAELWWDPASPLGAPLTIGTDVVGSFGGHVLATADGSDVTWQAADWRGSVAERDAWGRASDFPTNRGASLGFLGEVEVDGLVWLRARLYDPTTAAFLSPDPLAPVPATPVSANPYHYGANDPLGMVDPLGLQPVSIDDYNAARDAATGVQWGNIAKVAVVVGGIALTIACPALGPVALGVLGAGMGAAPGVIDGITTGHWDAGAIFKGAVVGGVAGVAGAYVPGAGAFLNASSGLGTRVAVTTAIGAADGFVAGNAGELYDLTGLPGADGRYDASSVAMGTLIGGGTGGGVTVGVALKNSRQAASGNFVDLASAQRRTHILDGDATGGGHRWPGNDGKTPFPRTMTDTEIMHNVSDVYTNPASTSTNQTGPQGSLYTNAGAPAKIATVGPAQGIDIKVVARPMGDGIITAHPVK
jgi:RHS repeat-associated protein